MMRAAADGAEDENNNGNPFDSNEDSPSGHSPDPRRDCMLS